MVDFDGGAVVTNSSHITVNRNLQHRRQQLRQAAGHRKAV